MQILKWISDKQLNEPISEDTVSPAITCDASRASSPLTSFPFPHFPDPPSVPVPRILFSLKQRLCGTVCISITWRAGFMFAVCWSRHHTLRVSGLKWLPAPRFLALGFLLKPPFRLDPPGPASSPSLWHLLLESPFWPHSEPVSCAKDRVRSPGPSLQYTHTHIGRTPIRRG